MLTACVVLACVLVSVPIAPKVLRRRCPECSKRSLVFQSLTVGAATEPTRFTQYTCTACKQRFACPERHVFIRIEDWDRGVRTSVPRAVIRRE
jgi:DNA-directed RNA polymerase subunit RPC12/RpoP